MDPLSVAASVVTLVHISNSSSSLLGRVIRRWRDAPAELLALSNEVSEIKLFLSEVDSACQDMQTSSVAIANSFLTSLEHEATRIRALFAELETLLKTLSVSLPDGNIKIKRDVWIRKSSVANNLRKDLRNRRLALVGLLNVYTSRQTLQNRISIQNVATIVTQLSAQLMGVRTRMDSNLTSGVRERQELLARLVQAQTHWGTALDVLSTLALNQSTNGPETLPGASGAIVTDMMPPADLLLRSSSANYARSLSTTTIRFNSYQPSQCPSMCACACHASRTPRIPKFLRRFVGSLFVGYSGSPSPANVCDSATCRRRKRAIDVAYYFPSWFVAKSLQTAVLEAEISAWGRTANIVIRSKYSWVSNTHDNVLYYANAGQIESIKRLFESREGSPHDLSEVGRTPLHYALYSQQYGTAKFLLDQGSNPHIEDDFGMSAYAIARIRFLSRDASIHVLNALEQMFVDLATSNAEDLLPLHKAILETDGSALGPTLEFARKAGSIDQQDSSGWTSLHLAARRGDLTAVQNLLRFQADPNIMNKNGDNALVLALQSQSSQALQCVESLLMARADAHLVNVDGWPSMLHAVNFQKNPSFLRALMAAGVDIQSQAAIVPLLSRACYHGRIAMINFLLEQGADPNVLDTGGETPLFHALWGQRLKAIGLLLDKGADYSIANYKGENLLHTTAAVGNVKTAEFLAARKLALFDIHATDRASMTALDHFVVRKDSPEGFEQAFHKLLQSVATAHDELVNHSAQHSGEAVEEDSEEEIWFDATEN